jgi:transcriptional regulator with PAS, ATPase and Fis domain
LIHQHSERVARPYRHEQGSNCAAADGKIVLSDWAGLGKKHGVSGVPSEGRDGILKICQGGTIFLDEIGDLPDRFQTFLFDVLDGDKEISPASGEGAQFLPDVRLIFATNLEFQEARRRGRLKDDFLQRIERYRIVIPHLKDRKDDILLFVKNRLVNRKATPAFLLSLGVVA